MTGKVVDYTKRIKRKSLLIRLKPLTPKRDEVDSIVWWEIQNDSLIIWTKEDEKRADIERLNYIRSLDTTGWE